MKILRTLLCILAAGLAFPAVASFHNFRLEQLYSNADGSVQFIVLKECCGADGENLLAGHTLTSTQGGITKTLTFPTNLPSSNTAHRSVLIATAGFAALGLVTPDYTIQSGFLFTNGGTVNYAGGFSILTYAALPTDGVTALNQDGTTGPNLATNFAGGKGSVGGTAVEYYNTVLDHYFMTSIPAEIVLLDAHAPPFQDWARTQQSFLASPTQATATLGPVCRFLIPPVHGDSHFFSAAPSDCAFLIMAAANPVQFPNFSGYIEETAAAFFITLPDITGACPSGTLPVFRLWNQRFDSNHRYTTSQAIVAQMQARNYVLEGNSPNFAVMCAAM